LPEVIVNTSPLQYLHQLRLLHVLPELLGRVIVPEQVAEELAVGRESGVDVPDPRSLDWVAVRRPREPGMLRLMYDLDYGEAAVLMVALEVSDPLVVIDDRLGRMIAESLHIPLRGTLGVLLDAKKRGLVDAVAPLVIQLERLGFRLSRSTAETVLRMAGEA